MPMKLKEGMKLKPQRRFIPIDREQIDEEKRTVGMSFSSEEPVDRWFGTEILVHEKNSANLTRLNSGAPLLFNHNRDDVVGVVERAEINAKERRGQATVRFARTARGEEIFGMVKDGILRNVSFAYRILTLEEKPKEETVRVTEWEPLEISMVTIPADITVGVGRLDGQEYAVRMVRTELKKEGAVMEKCAKCGGAIEEGVCVACGERAEVEAPPAAAKQHFEIAERGDPIAEAQRKVEKMNGAEKEAARKKAIGNLCRTNKLGANYEEMFVTQGFTLEEVSDEIVRILEERGKTNPQPVSRLGLTPTETQRFSMARAILAISTKDWSNAGFEAECSRAIAKKVGRPSDPGKFYVPFEVMERPVEGKRDLTVATAGAGGYLVGTDNISFIEMLRNRSVAFRMGATRLSGLTGNVTVPRQSAAATAYWLSTEATQITESQQTFVQMGLTPKNVGAYTEISRQLLLQSQPAAEGIVASDLATVIALEADLGALEGSGSSGQPTGISNTSGIGSVTGTSLAYSGILEFQTDVAAGNVMPTSGGYVTTPAVAALLMQRFTNATYGEVALWQGNVWDGRMVGFPAMGTNQVTAATMIFGDWSQLVIGEWGVLEVEVNPYANFQAGIIGVRGIYSMDVGVRLPVAFSRSTSIT